MTLFLSQYSTLSSVTCKCINTLGNRAIGVDNVNVFLLFHPLVFFTVVNCSHPNETTNGRYFLISNNGKEVDMKGDFNNTFSFNATLRFECNSGFILQDKYDTYRTCQQDETWSGIEPTCTGKHFFISIEQK